MYSWRPLTDKSRTRTVRIRVSFKVAPLVDRSCISVAPLRTIHELILSKFVRFIFLQAPLLIGRVLVAPLTDNSRTSTVQIGACYFFKGAPGDRA